MNYEDYIAKLIDRDKVKMPVKYTNHHNPRQPNAQCPACGWVLAYRIEQFCCACGQRFVDDKNDKFYKFRNPEEQDDKDNYFK